MLPEEVGVDSHLEGAVEADSHRSHIMDREVLVEGFFVRISQIKLGITFREWILRNFFPRSVDTF